MHVAWARGGGGRRSRAAPPRRSRCSTPPRLADDATVVGGRVARAEARELDEALMRRATVVVESRASAATAGDVVLAGAVDGHRRR
jgi:hypothetical protein